MTAITRMSKKLLQDFSDWLMARSEAPIRSTGGLPTPDRQAYPRVGQPEPSYRAFAYVPSYSESVRIGEPHQKRLVGDPLHLAPFVLASQLLVDQQVHRVQAVPNVAPHTGFGVLSWQGFEGLYSLIIGPGHTASSARFSHRRSLSYRSAPTTSPHDYTECTVRGTMIRPGGVALPCIRVLHALHENPHRK